MRSHRFVMLVRSAIVVGVSMALRRALESGLTRTQITEALTHLCFYAGWPKATKAMTAVTRSLGK